MQPLDELRNYISHFTNLDDKRWEELSSLFEPVHYKKGTHIYWENEVSDTLYFIIKGIVRSYKLEDDGRDFTWTFHCLNMDTLSHRMLMDIIVVDYVSFTQNRPEELAFEVLCDATLMKITKKDLYALYESNPSWQKFATNLAEDAYAVTRERTFNLLTKNAKERLQLLINYFPSLFELEVPTKHIASYLGITRQSFARLRRELNI